MFERAHGGFHRGSQIGFVMFLRQIVFAALCDGKFGQGEINAVARVAHLWPDAATLIELKWTDRTGFGRKAHEQLRDVLKRYNRLSH